MVKENQKYVHDRIGTFERYRERESILNVLLSLYI